MEEGVVGVIMGRERYVNESYDHQPYHDPVFLVASFEQCRGDKDDYRHNVDGEVVIMGNKIGSARHAVGQTAAVDGAEHDIKDSDNELC